MHQRVDVIRHHTPGQELIALLMKMQEGLLGQSGSLRVAEGTRTMPAIEVFLQLQALLSNVFDCQ